MLSEAHRQAIADTLVDREVDPEQVYLQLECISEGYQILERDRGLNRSNRARLQHEEEQVSQLITRSEGYRVNLHAHLNDFQRHPITGHDEIQPELCRLIREVESELASLEIMRRRIQVAINNLDVAADRFHGKSNPYRKHLYIGVLRIWTDIVGGELAYSRSPKGGLPYGPLIRFFRACLLPILNDKTPGASGLANIIDGVRNPKRHTKRKII
jgi:hypothetical protein